jgi:iron complex transport system substrate-binding protein
MAARYFRQMLPRVRILAAAVVLSSTAAASAHALDLVDIRGRTVTLAKPATRMVIDDGRFLVALSLILPDPVGVVAAWPKDINRIGTETYDALAAKFPALGTLPQIASSAKDFAVEPILAAAPDVAVFSTGSGPTDAQTAQLEAAGIPVVFIDFFQHPLQNLAPSLKILGAITGRQEQAEAFVRFRAAHLKAITDRVAALTPQQRPTVFLEAHAGMSADCCNSPGKGNVGDYIEVVGGHNIGADVIDHSSGKLNLEYVIERDPAVYIATGGPHLERTGGLVVGPGFTPERARAALDKVASRPGIASLTAVKTGNVHGFSHQLLNSPLDILAVEVFAKWIHPELFGDVDPAATLAEINTRFLAVPLGQNYWISPK